jgi:hypothetical protein
VNGKRKITQNSIEVDAETKVSTRKTKKNWIEGIRKVMNERNLKEGQWKDRKQWILGVGKRRKTFLNRYIYIYQLSRECYDTKVTNTKLSVSANLT